MNNLEILAEATKINTRSIEKMCEANGKLLDTIVKLAERVAALEKWKKDHDSTFSRV